MDVNILKSDIYSIKNSDLKHFGMKTIKRGKASLGALLVSTTKHSPSIETGPRKIACPALQFSKDFLNTTLWQDVVLNLKNIYLLSTKKTYKVSGC